jgi:hypothetical protein
MWGGYGAEREAFELVQKLALLFVARATILIGGSLCNF